MSQPHFTILEISRLKILWLSFTAQTVKATRNTSTAHFIPEIPAEGSSPVTVSWDTSGLLGDVNVFAKIDPADQVQELNEANNLASKTIHILSRPDMQVQSFDMNDTEPVSGQTVNIDLGVANEGTSPAEKYCNRPVRWQSEGRRAAYSGKHHRSRGILSRESILHLAAANPRLAPPVHDC